MSAEYANGLKSLLDLLVLKIIVTWLGVIMWDTSVLRGWKPREYANGAKESYTTHSWHEKRTFVILTYAIIVMFYDVGLPSYFTKLKSNFHVRN